MDRKMAFAELVRLSGRLEKPRTAALGQAHSILYDSQRPELALGQAVGRFLDPQQFRKAAAPGFYDGIDDAPVTLLADQLQRLVEREFLRQRHIKRHQRLCALAAGQRLPNRSRLVANDRFAAAVAVAPGEVRPQMFHVIADLGHRADGRTGGAYGIALAQRDGGRDAVDPVDLRLVHPVKKLPDIRRERLDVAPLALGEERVEGE